MSFTAFPVVLGQIGWHVASVIKWQQKLISAIFVNARSDYRVIQKSVDN